MTELSVKDKTILTTSGYLRHLWLTTYGSADMSDLDGDIMAFTFSFYYYPAYNISKEKFNQEIAIKITDYLNEPRIVNNSDKQFIDRDLTIDILHTKPANHGRRWSSDEEGKLEEYINSDNPTKPKAIQHLAKKLKRTPSAIANKISKLRANHSRCRSKNIMRYKYWSPEEHYVLIQHINDNSDKPTKPQDIKFYANKCKRTPAAIRQKINKLIKMNETEILKITNDFENGVRDKDFVVSGQRLYHCSDSVQNENLQNPYKHQLQPVHGWSVWEEMAERESNLKHVYDENNKL